MPECHKCGYKWASRVKEPKTCPRCKSYDFTSPRACAMGSNSITEVIGREKNGNLVLGKTQPMQKAGQK